MKSGMAIVHLVHVDYTKWGYWEEKNPLPISVRFDDGTEEILYCSAVRCRQGDRVRVENECVVEKLAF